mmetsp:Transcript_17211/g.16878  ORF Transcript_17211/g.16878 Transcript_17211/m.16878 type:complete len:223 (+) Transcript_17211:19-687(+)
MSKFDSFNRDLNKLKKLEADIKTLVKDKNTGVASGKPTTKIDYMLKGKVETFKYELGRMRETVFNMAANPYKYGISEREAEKRTDKVGGFEEKLKTMEAQIQLAVSGGGIGTINNQSSNDLGLENDLEENLIGEDGEYENTRGKNNQEILQVEKDMLKGQDKHFDELAAVAHNLKEEAKNGGEEIDYQNGMLDDLNKNIDKTNIKMVRVDGRLKKLVAESHH